MRTTFKICSVRIAENPLKSGEKKYIAYSVLIEIPSDRRPVVIERRYSDFLELYRILRKESPELMSQIVFPKKVIFGNFSENVVLIRSQGFITLLQLVSKHEKLRESVGMKEFLIGPEEKEGLYHISVDSFLVAYPILQKIFYTVSKFYTDRHPSVLIALCRLVACCYKSILIEDAEKYGELALKRFETVSDVDMLRFYVPLLQMCLQIWMARGRDEKLLEARLNSLRMQGHRVDDCQDLFTALSEVSSINAISSN